MLTITKQYAVQLLEEAARALASGSSYQQALSAEITEAIKYSVFATLAQEHRAAIHKPPKKEKPPRPVKVKTPIDTQRLERIDAMCAEGKTLQQIGEAFGVTRERARQIIKKYGIERTNQPRTKTADAAARRKAAHEQRCIEKWGVGIEGTKKLNEAGVIKAFMYHRNAAHAQLIEWRLPFVDWYATWLASGHFDQRGRGAGKYVMARIDRSKPFEPGNVEILLNQDHLRKVRARSAGNVATRTGVYCLYPGLAKPWVARVHRRTVGHFATAEAAVAAREQALAQAA
jgi:hypothetical protein